MKSESKLQTDVLHKSKWGPSVNASLFGVEACNRITPGSGQLTPHTQKISAERPGKHVYRLVALANDVEVESRGGSDGGIRHSDRDFAAAALAAIKWDFEATKNKIALTVRAEWATSQGVVYCRHEKDAAAHGVSYLLCAAYWAAPVVTSVAHDMVVAH